MDVLKKLTVLIVEDEEDTKNLMKQSLEKVFKWVETAQNGDEGFKKFKKYSPNIVLTDIAMPIADGLEMTKKIKEISPHTPILVLSAFSEKEKLLKAIEVGVNKYILKPIDMEELLSSLEDIARNSIQFINDIDLGGGLLFNPVTKILTKNGVKISLTKKELVFISLLINNIDKVVDQDVIKKNVWLCDKVNDAAIRTFIKRVRDKIGSEYIINISGVGYQFEKKINF